MHGKRFNREKIVILQEKLCSFCEQYLKMPSLFIITVKRLHLQESIIAALLFVHLHQSSSIVDLIIVLTI